MKVEIEGLTIEYTEAGSGTPLLLLHGWGCNNGHWAPIVAALQEKYHLIVPDIPGFGQSDEPPADWGTAQFADLMAAFMQKLGLEHPAIAGHSNGGRIAITLAGRGLCSRLILVDSAGIVPQRSASYYRKVYTYKAFKRLLDLPLLRGRKEEILEKRRKKSGSADYQAASPVMRQVMSRVLNEDLRPELAKVTVPTLLVWGDCDTATPLADGEAMEAILKQAGSDCALIVFQGGTHFAYLEQSARFASVVEAFLRPMEVQK